MATFYLDLVGGNDSNDGTTFANRWLTFASGATAARIAPGDTIRVMQSPQPTAIGDATWTTNSGTVTLAGAATATIHLCNSIWTAGAGTVTVSNSTSRKEGSNSCLLQCAAGFTTGKIGYIDLGSNQDFSGYEQVSFYINSNVAMTAGQLTLDLCSDTVGATPVNTISIPAIPAGNLSIWTAFTVNTGAALGSAIRSVSLNAVSDPGTVNLFLDNIIACKAAGSADSLSLTSLIGKGTTDEPWLPIRSINGTTVMLDSTCQAVATSVDGKYGGASETVASYKRETIKIQTTGTACAVQDSGTAGNLITFIGGWDTTAMTTRDGETWVDGVTSVGVGYTTANRHYVRLERFGFTKYNGVITISGTNNEMDYVYVTCSNGIAFQIASINNVFGTVFAYSTNNTGFRFLTADGSYIDRIPYCCGNGGSGILFQNASGHRIRHIDRIDNNGTTNITFNNCSYTRIDYIGSASNSQGNGIYFEANAFENSIGYVGACAGNGTSGAQYGINNGANASNYINGGNVGVNRTACVNTHLGNLYLRNVTLSPSGGINLRTNNGSAGKVFSMYEGNNPAVNFVNEPGGEITSDSTTRHTASGISWKLSPTSATLIHQYYPLVLSVAKIAVLAGGTVTITAYMQRSNTAIAGGIRVKAYDCPGITSEQADTISVSAGNWELLSISFSPTQNGLVELEAFAYGGTTHSVYIDDISVTQA